MMRKDLRLTVRLNLKLETKARFPERPYLVTRKRRFK
jgi:hypothetical protein